MIVVCFTCRRTLEPGEAIRVQPRSGVPRFVHRPTVAVEGTAYGWCFRRATTRGDLISLADPAAAREYDRRDAGAHGSPPETAA